MYDGGIRVPGIIGWSGIKTDKKVVEAPTGLVDLLPTLCEIVGIYPLTIWMELAFTPFRGKPFERKLPLYWFFYRTSPEIAMRIGDRDLRVDNDTIPRPHQFSQDDLGYLQTISLKNYELYDLRNDFSQEKPFHSHPKRLTQTID